MSMGIPTVSNPLHINILLIIRLTFLKIAFIVLLSSKSNKTVGVAIMSLHTN